MHRIKKTNSSAVSIVKLDEISKFQVLAVVVHYVHATDRMNLNISYCILCTIFTPWDILVATFYYYFFSFCIIVLTLRLELKLISIAFCIAVHVTTNLLNLEWCVCINLIHDKVSLKILQ